MRSRIHGVIFFVVIFMRKKPEYRAACGGDEWQMGVWGQSPQDAFYVKRYPAACRGVLHFLFIFSSHPTVSILYTDILELFQKI